MTPAQLGFEWLSGFRDYLKTSPWKLTGSLSKGHVVIQPRVCDSYSAVRSRFQSKYVLVHYVFRPRSVECMRLLMPEAERLNEAILDLLTDCDLQGAKPDWKFEVRTMEKSVHMLLKHLDIRDKDTWLEQHFLAARVGKAMRDVFVPKVQRLFVRSVSSHAKTVSSPTSLGVPEPADIGVVQRALADLEIEFTAENSKSSIYFLQAGAAGSIKIGTSANPRSRTRTIESEAKRLLKALRIDDEAVEFSVLATIEFAGRQLESALHSRFTKHHIIGEWFEPADELLGLIAALNDGTGSKRR